MRSYTSDSIPRKLGKTKVRQFYNRRLQREETLRQFAGDLKCLISKAYPNGLSRHVMKEMLLKQFFDGLEDKDLRYYVEYLKNPENLDEAVELVYEYDEYRNIKRETISTEEKLETSQDDVRIIGKKSRNQSSNNGTAQSRSKSRQHTDEEETESNKNGSMEKVQARLGDLTRKIGDLTQLLRGTYQQSKTSADIRTKQESADYKVGGHKKIQDEKQDLN